MYIVRVVSNVWVVGFYTYNHQWHTRSRHGSEMKALLKRNELNEIYREIQKNYFEKLEVNNN